MAGEHKVRVKMRTSIAGKPAYCSGDVVELSPEVAKAWIEEGYCVIDRSEAPIETAARR